MRVQRDGFRTEDGGREGWEGWPVKIQESEVITEGEMGGFGSEPRRGGDAGLAGEPVPRPEAKGSSGEEFTGKGGCHF